MLAGVREELPSQFRLAWPLVLSELGWMSMGIVDTLMVGRISPEALGGVAAGGNFVMPIALFGLGILLGLDPLISQATGAGRPREARRALEQGLLLAGGLSVALSLVLVALTPMLTRIGLIDEILPHMVPYYHALIWGVPPFLGFICLRRYLQNLGHVRTILWALLSANLLNLVADYALIFGRFGLPACGAAGAGWATSLSRLYMFLFLAVAIVRLERREGRAFSTRDFRPDVERLRSILRIGFPAAVQIVLEVGVFAVASQIIGGIDAVSLAAHQVALSLASLTFMVPLGVSAAGGVRVGHAVGRLDSPGMARAGWTALVLGAAFMSCSGVVFAVAGRPLTALFTPDPAVIAVGGRLLQVAALFQLFDGIQVVATGVLRGLGETRLPMLANLVGHWAIGLPVGWWFCFRVGLGVTGLWLGLSAGLIVVGLLLLGVWTRRVRGFRPAIQPAAAVV